MHEQQKQYSGDHFGPDGHNKKNRSLRLIENECGNKCDRHGWNGYETIAGNQG